ncbi:MAG: anti-sigma factor [Anaerolineae bacterium]|jgi:hypothetical protein|nr:anti-sigma factor [Anaerolineae bacterium]
MNANNGVKPNDCEQLSDLLPAYALRLTTPEESAIVQELLPLCPDASADLKAYREIGEALLYSVPQMPLPPHMRERLLQRTADQPTIATSSSNRDWITIGIAAAAIIVLLISLRMVLLMMEQSASTPVTLLRAIAQERTVSFPLRPLDTDTTYQAVLICDPDATIGMVYLEDFPIGHGRYQLWLWREEERVNAGVILVDGEGDGLLVFQAPELMRNYRYATIADQDHALARGALYQPPPIYPRR